MSTFGPNQAAKVIIHEGDGFDPPFVPTIDDSPGPIGPQGPDGFGELHEDFISTLGQTLFALSTTPADLFKMLMIVDHMVFYPVQDFTLAGNVVTWIGAPTNFNMLAGQDVRIYYTDN